VNSHAGVTLASGGDDEKGNELRATNKAQTKNGSREKAKRPAPKGREDWVTVAAASATYSYWLFTVRLFHMMDRIHTI